MSDRSKVKITVERMLSTLDVFGDNREKETISDFVTKCPKFHEGQEFIVEKNLEKPEIFVVGLGMIYKEMWWY